ncbi:hypothetical protein VTK73DRAFT_4613 [Phialemonium thermophilum]|uniref:Uncharacterized protein n=1 Tax=Phialemonium thermophilum TaxID=223376 RepID=A0ABR3WSZ9_9PEZI
MRIKSVSAAAVLAFAAHATASEAAVPYKPLVKMSVRQMFGVVRRDTGYQPTQSECGTGNSCAEACGAGYATCASNDNFIHCYDTATQQTCCPDGTGNSCDAGYYCTQDTTGQTWCCPEGLDVVACAAAYSVSGGLVSETPKPTTTAAPSSTAPPTTSAAPSTSAGFSSYLPRNSTTSYSTSTTSCPVTGTISPSASYPATNATSTKYTISSPAPTPSQSQVISGAAGSAAPVGALGLLLAIGAAALL